MAETESLKSQLEAELIKVAQFPNFNPGPVLRLDLDAHILLANRAAAAVLGSDALLGQSWLDVCPGINTDRWAQATNAVLEPFCIDAAIGDRFFAFNHVRSPDDALVFVFGTDVTARLVAEREVREVARFPDMNPGPVLRMSEDSCVLLNNTAARHAFGEDLVGQRWLEICPGMTAELWSSVLATPDVIRHEANVDGRALLFAHRHDPTSGLVFVFGSDITQHKLTERALVQAERMATLGTLAAGVAHELNNPAAATRRAADQLADALGKLDQARDRLRAAVLDATGVAAVAELERRAASTTVAAPALDPVSQADAEADMEERLDDLDVVNAWELAPALIQIGLDGDELTSLERQLGRDVVAVILPLVAQTVTVRSLISEIAECSARISSIVNALKGYSYLDQAPNQDVDIHRGLDDTLTILASKLRTGIDVRRDYDADLPRIPAYGGELNQVWTNLIDNAVDAMSGVGRLTITTRRHDDYVIVEIADTGPGVAPDVAERVFDPFFTTKPQGKGTGLGLSTSRSIIVDRHAGAISVESTPGATCFRVRLPLTGPVPRN